jgi:hypothetical protein
MVRMTIGGQSCLNGGQQGGGCRMGLEANLPAKFVQHAFGLRQGHWNWLLPEVDDAAHGG